MTCGQKRVGIAEIKVGAAPEVLISYGLGSCLALTLHDPTLRVGGMAHTLLPAHLPGTAPPRPGKFVDTAVARLLELVLEAGARRQRLVAKFVGGANMFEAILAPGREQVGARNAEAARATLEAFGIPLVAEDSGGNYGRSAEFLLATGEVRVRTVYERDAFLVL